MGNDFESSAIALVQGERNVVANLANLSSHIFHSMPGLNWCGFYLWDEVDQELVLAPFQGKPACLRIRPDRGVCGKAYSTLRTQRVDDVHEFPGHITCDPDSRSELVIPLISDTDGRCLGVLDLDAPVMNRFSEGEALRLEALMSKLVPLIWNNPGQ